MTPHRKRWLLSALLGWLVLAGAALPWWPQPWDHQGFLWLNGSLREHRSLQSLLGFANTRLFDSLAGLILGAFFLVPGLGFERGRRIAGIAGFLPFFLCLQIWRHLVGWWAGMTPSPGRVFWSQMVKLNEIWPAAKIASDHSFPSDHTAVLLVWTVYICVVGTARLRWLSLAVALTLSLPRLFGGGHWISDVVLGAPLVALPPLLLCFGLKLRERFMKGLRKHPKLHMLVGPKWSDQWAEV